MLRKMVGLMLCMGLLLTLLPTMAQEVQLYETSLRLLEYVKAGQEEEALSMMDETLRSALKGQLTLMWPQLTGLGGEFLGAGEYQAETQDGYDIILLDLKFEKTGLVMRNVFDQEGKLSGLFFAPGELQKQQEPLPQGVREIDLTIDAGTGYPLAAKLSLPEGEPLAGIVLVQGSGPSNMDESIGANAPFRDLAWGLAQQGIAALRFDKRTLSYGEKMTGLGISKLTVDEETVQDARAAFAVLRDLPELSDKPVILLGHSLGAMLASYIGSQGRMPDGYILLAGTPKKLWEISAKQNLAVADEFERAGDKTQAEAIRTFVKAQKSLAQGLSVLDDEEALSADPVFGMSAWYLRHLEGIDAAPLHLEDQKPILILQGEKDKQVDMVDFESWKEQLASHPDASFISYPDLNHLFGHYEGEPVPLTSLVSIEYAQRTPVSQEVIKDIAKWVHNLSE